VPVARISANTRHGDDDDNDDNEEGGPPGDGTTRAATAAAAAAENVIRGGAGTCFRDDMVSSLPFVETHVSASERTRDLDMVLTDGERLVAFVRAVSQPSVFFFVLFFAQDSDTYVCWFALLQGQRPTFEVHVLEDYDEPSARAEVEVSRRSRSRSPRTPPHPYRPRLYRALPGPAADLAYVATQPRSQTGV
jgi:hypothetical protein